jgi:hypothetical protein
MGVVSPEGSRWKTISNNTSNKLQIERSEKNNMLHNIEIDKKFLRRINTIKFCSYPYYIALEK